MPGYYFQYLHAKLLSYHRSKEMSSTSFANEYDGRTPQEAHTSLHTTEKTIYRTPVRYNSASFASSLCVAVVSTPAQTGLYGTMP